MKQRYSHITVVDLQKEDVFNSMFYLSYFYFIGHI